VSWLAGDFENVGVARVASSGRSLKLELHLPNTVFMEVAYVSIKDIEKVIAKHKKNATIWQVKGKKRNSSGENRELQG